MNGRVAVYLAPRKPFEFREYPVADPTEDAILVRMRVRKESVMRSWCFLVLLCGTAQAIPIVDPGPFSPIVSPFMPWTRTSFGSYINNGGQTKPYSVSYHVPENAKALVFFFHGTTGRSDIVERLESIVILGELIRHGYGFVSTDSQRRDDNLLPEEKVQWFHSIDRCVRKYDSAGFGRDAAVGYVKVVSGR